MIFIVAFYRHLTIFFFSICDITANEIAKIERHQREINNEINKLQKELQFCKNSLEIKIMSDRIFDKRVCFRILLLQFYKYSRTSFVKPHI